MVGERLPPSSCLDVAKISYNIWQSAYIKNILYTGSPTMMGGKRLRMFMVMKELLLTDFGQM